MKKGSSLVVSPSSIPSSATRGPDVDLSSKRSKDILEDPNDEPTLKKRVSDPKEEENVKHEAKFMGMYLFILLSFLLPLFFFLLSPLYVYTFM